VEKDEDGEDDEEELGRGKIAREENRRREATTEIACMVSPTGALSLGACASLFLLFPPPDKVCCPSGDDRRGAVIAHGPLVPSIGTSVQDKKDVHGESLLVQSIDSFQGKTGWVSGLACVYYPPPRAGTRQPSGDQAEGERGSS